MRKNPTQRFSGREEAYHRFRPGYPKEALSFASHCCDLKAGAHIADFGAGTGIFTRLLLDKGFFVHAVEPNAQMRGVLTRELQHKMLSVLDGSAEQSTLPDNSIDAVCAAQAFHWFDKEKCTLEFKRILRSDGGMFFVWNERDKQATPFLRSYEALLHTYCPEYRNRRLGYADESIMASFFGQAKYHKATFPHRKKFDFEALAGLLHSSSYVPLPGGSLYDILMQQVKTLFEEHKEEDDTVTFLYRCSLYYAKA